MKRNEHEKIKSLRLYHVGIIVLSVLGVLAVAFTDNWDEYLVWFPIAVTIFFDGRFEKNDELAKLNIGKANTVTMWLLIAALIYLGMFARFHAIRTVAIIIMIFFAFAIRSVLFLIFDITLLGGNDSNG